VIPWGRGVTGVKMADNELFSGLPEVRHAVEPTPRSAVRLLEPQRDQVELRAVDIESLLGEDHPARVIWTYVEGLDLSALEERVKAREDRPGRPATSPRLLLALWLVATSDGVGSARALERLCDHHDVYRWLCGGVPVNYHTLSDFRVGHADLLDELLAEHLAALAKAKLVDLATLSQDGVRIRASAGAASFRRQATLDRHLATAQAVVDKLKQEVDANSDASNKRMKAARERAALERTERLNAAQAALGEIKQRRELRKNEPADNGKKPKPPRASTTDPQARVLKMADGGFRPAYNVQVTSVAGEQIIVDVAVCNTSSDRGLLRPALERLRARNGYLPAKHLADGGFGSAKDIEWAFAEGVKVYCPPTKSKHGTDPYQPKRDDGPGALAWRARMASEIGQELYKLRAICECIHARWRNWDLRQLSVRGLDKVRAIILLHALTNNILQGHNLRVFAPS
jgi:transposase